ncbi:hypothetical protein OHT59_24960 [Streptomyces sp. NBC_00243]|uniref:hypothetical protein n=1 Tax=Streptomyces sp. NBC_00243 TaxID=2975688 RepID=UPI002DD883FE|nr:hypothetical protein [Streptomyces sp. NBC_00243]WRZ21503.1 hypothetical protein OHT59_24960 [Streptomyces sp. NBC_00243]
MRLRLINTSGGPPVAARRTVFIVVLTVLCALAGPGVGVGWADSGGGPAAVAASPAAAKRPAWQATSSAPSPGLPALPAQKQSPGASPSLLACDTHAVGTWAYNDQAGVQHNGMNMQVQVRDLRTGARIAGLTNSAGRYDICFTAAQFTQLYITFAAENGAWRVQNGTNIYNWSTPVRANPVAGSTVNFGTQVPGDGTAGHRAAHAFDEANDAWVGVPHTNGCWDPKDTTCRQLRINWSNTAVGDTDFYDQVGNVVQLLAVTPDAPMEVMHEIGHALMDDVYNDAFPSTVGCPRPHPPNQASTAVCAWIEGWADFFSLAMYHTPVFQFGIGTSMNFEFPTWGFNGVGNGDVTETRVAGALWDLIDINSSGAETWDQHSEGFGAVFFPLARHVDNTLASFWSSRGTEGFDVSDSSLGSLYQNTIDYGYRKPLLDARGQFLPAFVFPGPPQNFSLNTAVQSWSVVALRPSNPNDFNLLLYDDRAQTSVLGGSALGGQTVDFVAIDSNLRPVGDYYPRVSLFQGGPGTYTIESVMGFTTLQPGSSTSFHLDDSQVAAVQDTPLTAGVPVTITLTTTSPISVASLFVMGDDPSAPSTFVQSRSSAVASAVGSNSGGQPVSVTFTPTRTGEYGIVTTFDNVGGDYTLTRS